VGNWEANHPATAGYGSRPVRIEQVRIRNCHKKYFRPQIPPKYRPNTPQVWYGIPKRDTEGGGIRTHALSNCGIGNFCLPKHSAITPRPLPLVTKILHFFDDTRRGLVLTLVLLYCIYGKGAMQWMAEALCKDRRASSELLKHATSSRVSPAH
jgi:hypothetical protein